MKKSLCIFIALVLLAGLISFPPAARAEESAVRVLLSTENRDTLTLALSGTYELNGTEMTGGTLTVAVSGTEVIVTHSELGSVFTGEKAVLIAQSRENLFTLATAGGKEYRYRGNASFSVDGGAVQVVNTVGMEDYMLGVAICEVGSNAPEEMLKAGLITAKNYALAEIGVRGGKAYDVDDTHNDQIYRGFDASATKAIACAAQVADQTLLYNGQAIKTHYGDSNGGVVLTPKAKWGGSQAYSGAYECKFDPFDITRSDAVNLMIPVSGEAPETLPEKLYTYLLSKTGGSAITAITDLEGYSNGDHPKGYAPQDGFRITLKVSDGGTQTVDVTFDELSGNKVVLSDNSVVFAAKVKDGSWMLCWGKSSGPRVGMSHSGARRMAEMGYSYADILKFYYPNAELTKDDGSVVRSKADLSTEAIMTALGGAENRRITRTLWVTVGGTEIMSKASSSADVCARLPFKSQFGVYEKSGDWYYGIDLATGVQGWIAKKNLSEQEPAAEPTPAATSTPALTGTPAAAPTDTPASAAGSATTPSQDPASRQVDYVFTKNPVTLEEILKAVNVKLAHEANRYSVSVDDPSKIVFSANSQQFRRNDISEVTLMATEPFERVMLTVAYRDAAEVTIVLSCPSWVPPQADYVFTKDTVTLEEILKANKLKLTHETNRYSASVDDPSKIVFSDNSQQFRRSILSKVTLTATDYFEYVTLTVAYSDTPELTLILSYPSPDPTPVPDPTETPAPTGTPVPDPTETPAPDPTETPAPDPTETPAPDPTETPAPGPTETPAPDPTPLDYLTEPTEAMVANALIGVLNKDSVILRKGPAANYSAVASGITIGSEVTVYAEDGDFYFLRVDKLGKYGYINKQYVVIIGEANPSPDDPLTIDTLNGTLNRNSVELRRGPGSDYGKVASGLAKGTKVTIYLEDSGFYFLRVDNTGKYGYVDKSHVDLEGAALPTPTPTATPKPTPSGPYTEPTWQMIENSVDGVLIKGGVNMRKGPGTNYGLADTGLKKGTTVTVFLKDGDWYFLQVDDTGKYGYIYADYIELVDDDDPKPTKKPTEEPSIRLSQGDVNGDGLVSAADAALILRYDAGIIDLTDAQLKAADMDGDKQVTDLDAKALLKYVAGRLAR